MDDVESCSARVHLAKVSVHRCEDVRSWKDVFSYNLSFL